MPDGASLLVGRRAELAALDRALGEAERGDARAVGLRGEPGIGKSRLLGELADRASASGLLVLGGRAAELERDLPFALLSDALEPLPEEALSEAVRELEAEHLDELAPVVPALAARPDGASGERHRAARAVRALLERLAARRPVALLVDDVHWADPASADVLALLLHRLPRGGVLLGLATRAGRAPGLEGALAAAQQAGLAEVLELGPLPEDAVEALLPQAGRVARERLYRESGGNPFYLQELARAGAGTGDGGRAGLPGVPKAVHAALVRELAALPAPARGVLEGAAVAGDPFEPELAAVAAGVDEEAALIALDELMAADLVRPAAQPRRFRFRHPLVRRAVYEGSGGGWRLAAHARAAEALAGRGATPAQRAHHTERAARHGDVDAVELLAAAAEEAAPAAPATAAGWCEAALRLLPDGPGHDERRLRLLMGAGDALASAGRPAEASDALRRVLALLPPGAQAERVEVVVMLAELEARWLQRPDEAQRLLEDERVAVGETSAGLTAALTLAMAYVQAEKAEHSQTHRLAEEAAAMAQAAGDPVLEATALAEAADAAHCAARDDDPRVLAAVTEEIATAAARVGALSDDQVAEGVNMAMSLAIAQVTTGDFAVARATAERGLTLARRTRQGLIAPGFVALRGYADEQLGRLDAAEADQEEALESALLSGNVQVAYWGSAVLSWIALARGRIEAALAHAQTAWDLIGTSDYSQAGFTMADARLAAGDPEAALAALDAFGTVKPQMWTLDRVRAVEVAVRVMLALGRIDEAQEWAGRVAAEGGGRRTGVFAAIGAHAEGRVLLARDAADEAARVALGGATGADQGLAPVWAGRCRILAGEALAAGGRTGEAIPELRLAAAALEDRGAFGYRDAALRVLRRLGERPRAAAPPRAEPVGDDRLAALTPREREVAELVAEGLTNAQIAARLHLSERTVEKHVSSSLGKLGLSTRTGVVRLFS